MQEENVGVQSAIDYLGDLFHRYMCRFNEERAALPSWGPEMDRQVNVYVNALADWIIGSIHWSFESERYFGTKGLQVRKVGKAPRLAKRVMDPEMRREKVEVQLIDKLSQVPSDAILFGGLRGDILELA